MNKLLEALKMLKEDFVVELDEYLQHTSLKVLAKNFNLYFKEQKLNYDFYDFIPEDMFIKNQMIFKNLLEDITNDDKLADNENIYVKDEIKKICPDFEKICDKCGYYVAKHKKIVHYYIIRDSLQESTNLQNLYLHLSVSDKLDKIGIKPKKSKSNYINRNKKKNVEDYDERIYLISAEKLLLSKNPSNEIKSLAKALDAHYLYTIVLSGNYPIYEDHAYPYGVYVRNYIKPIDLSYYGKI